MSKKRKIVIFSASFSLQKINIEKGQSMNINKISNSINIPKKINVELPKIDKEKVANVGKKALTGLSCLAAVGYYLVANSLQNKPSEEDATPIDKSDKTDKPDPPSSDDFALTQVPRIHPMSPAAMPLSSASAISHTARSPIP